MKYYKHFISVTAQLYFCSSPIRIDSYNRCQFGCTYCFSRARSSNNSPHTLREANDSSFERRLDRISKAEINSGLDEFLQRRVPIQLGGLQDPFSPMERSRKVTLRLLKVLNEHGYPTIISTKGNLFLRREYMDLLSDMNVYVRLSAAGVAEEYRAKVDYRCGSFEEIIEKIHVLSQIPVPVSLRIQPVIPGFETQALDMAAQAVSAGAKHVSFEYLKIATEQRKKDCQRISRAIGIDIWAEMQRLGTKRIGRDYILNVDAKRGFLCAAKKLCSQLNAKFGAGDTEFIHLSDGDGCCSGSGFFLRDANQFRANLTGVLSRKESGELVQFCDLFSEWSPQRNIHAYLTTDSRGRDTSGKYNDWLSLIAHRWNGGRSPYSPAFFADVSWTGHFDEQGFKIYEFVDPLS